jgi:hypothetical protein
MPSAVILSRLSYPAVPLAGQPVHQRSVLPSPLVLRKHLLKIPTPTADRDRPGSRRSEPSSRTTLIGEQPNPWDRLQPQDVMSRHRGAKPPRRYERSGKPCLHIQTIRQNSLNRPQTEHPSKGKPVELLPYPRQWVLHALSGLRHREYIETP